jgi:F0F1-type ATP synthase delta subunit
MNKQIKIKLYAKALAEVLSQKNVDEKKVIINFVNILAKSGYESKTNEILDLAENMLLQKQGKKKIVFETARKTTSSQRKILDGFVEKGDVVKEKNNPELIAGIKIIINGEKQLDNSMLNKLNNII